VKENRFPHLPSSFSFFPMAPPRLSLRVACYPRSFSGPLVPCFIFRVIPSNPSATLNLCAPTQRELGNFEFRRRQRLFCWCLSWSCVWQDLSLNPFPPFPWFRNNSDEFFFHFPFRLTFVWSGIFFGCMTQVQTECSIFLSIVFHVLFSAAELLVCQTYARGYSCRATPSSPFGCR